MLNWIPTEPGLCYQLGKNIKISFAGQKIPVKTSTYLTNYRYKKIMAPEEIFLLTWVPKWRLFVFNLTYFAFISSGPVGCLLELGEGRFIGQPLLLSSLPTSSHQETENMFRHEAIGLYKNNNTKFRKSEALLRNDLFSFLIPFFTKNKSSG